MGRPVSVNPRQKRVETKMTADELEKLNFCCERTGKTRSEIVREGIDIVYERLQNDFKK